MTIDKTAVVEEKASVAEFYKIVLQWDYFALKGEKDETANGPGLKKVKNTYDNIEDYLKTFEPLLLEEAKAQIRQLNEDEEGISVVQQKLGVIKNWRNDGNESNGFWFPAVYYESEEGETISQNDLLIVSNEKFGSYSKPSTYAFALAEDRQKESLRLRMYFPKDAHGVTADSKRLVNMRVLVSGEDKVVYISKVCSLSTISREFVALRSMHTLPFKDLILRADDNNSISTCNPWNIRASLTEFIESNHNASQLQAIRAGLSRKPIVLIQGPPGTGKTQTILGLLSAILHATPARTRDKGQPRSSRRVLELSREEMFRNFALASPWLTGSNPRDIDMPVDGDDGFYPVTGNELKPDIVIGSRKYRVRVLVCAPSNSALDEIVLRVLHRGIRDENGHAYSPKIVRIGLKPHHSVQTVSIDYLAERKRSGMGDQRQGAYAKDTDSIRTSILEESVIVFSTLSFSGTISTKLKHGFDVVVIDEAAQAVEPSILVPLMNGCKQVVLVGDPNQLPATVVSEAAKKLKYGLSLFTRFQKAGYPVVMLQHQYRMHPEIREFPSKQFYADKLVDGPDVEEQTKRAWHDFRCFGPFCFFDVHEGEEKKPEGSSSWINDDEVDFVLLLYQKLVDRYPELKSSSRLAMISPYRLQVKQLRKRFQEVFGIDSEKMIDINTVDGFQGREKDVAIFTCVRAHKDEEESKDTAQKKVKGLGFVADDQRLNVGITRAKSSILVVGSALTLRKDKTWNNLVKHAEKKGQLFKVSKPFSSFWSDQRLESMRVSGFVEPVADMDINVYGNPEHADAENDLNEENNEEGFDGNMDDAE